VIRMEKKNKFFVIFIFLIIYTIFGFSIPKQNNNKKNNIYINYPELSRIKGVDINFIPHIFNQINFNNFNNFYLLVYREHDCNVCIKQLLKLFNRKNLLILYFSDNNDENYSESKYKKREENINFYLKKMKYIRTPVILRFDSTFKVLDAFFPTVKKEKEFKDFIDK